MKKIRINLILIMMLIAPCISGQKTQPDKEVFFLAAEGAELYRSLYTDLHRNPELSLLEYKTSDRMAAELLKLGFEVTGKIGGTGVVGIFRNGPGKVIMLRTDMDALPVKENTGLPFSSEVVMKDINGVENPVMHACGHDMHMSVWLGTLRTLVKLRSEWSGTLFAIAQPGEEGSMGALLMIKDGLFKKFPVPDYALCYHVSAELPAGTIGYYPGPVFAGVKSAEITVYGSGGHGAMPHTTIDPIVMASQIVLDIQTIVSRKINPVKPAVVTVGSIHGGSRNNVIPDEVKMKLTIRFFEEEVFNTIKESLISIARGTGIEAGLPEDKLPHVVFDDSDNPPVANDPGLVMNSVAAMKGILGDKNVIQVDPATVAEDFGKYGRTDENIPIALFWLGGVNIIKYEEHIRSAVFLPPLHNSAFYPDYDQTFRTGVTAMTRAMIDLYKTER